MLRRTRIRAVANLPVRRAKDGTGDSVESTTSDATSRHKSLHKVKNEDNCSTEIPDAPVAVLCTDDNTSSLSSVNDTEVLCERNLSLETGCVVITSPRAFRDTPSVCEIQSFENDDESSTQNDIGSVPRETKSIVCFTTETDSVLLSASVGNSSTQAALEGQLEPAVLTGKDVSSNQNLTVGGVCKQNNDSLASVCALPKSRYAQCIPKFLSNKDVSRKITSSSKEFEDRHKIPKPILPQLSPARGYRSLEQRKTSSTMNYVEEGVSCKHAQMKKIHRKVRNSITVRLSKAKQEFKSKYRDAKPDRSSLTMFDLIYYNPETNPMRQTGQQETLEALVQPDSNELVVERLEEEEVDAGVENNNEETSVPVPQVRLGADGQLIIDEKSLVIETTDAIKSKQLLANSSIVMDAGDGPSSYLAYNRKTRSRMCTSWTKIETLRFYVGLKTFGTDFLLMQSIFPQFSRQELKLKYKKEERVNRDLVQEALRRQNFDPEQMEKDLRKLQEKERCLELSQSEDPGKKKEFVQFKKKTAKNFKVRRNRRNVPEVERCRSSERCSRAVPIEYSSDETEVDEVSNLNEIISGQIPREESTKYTTNVNPTVNLNACFSNNTDNSKDSEETVTVDRDKNNGSEVRSITTTKGTRNRMNGKNCNEQQECRRRIGRPSTKQNKIRGNYRVSNEKVRKVKGRTCNDGDLHEIYNAEEGMEDSDMTVLDASENSRDGSDIDEEVCSIMETIKETVVNNDVNFERFHDDMQNIENEPRLMENELRRLVGNAGGEPPTGSHNVPLGGDVTAPTPGSLYILSSVSPTNPSHHIYKVFMVAPSEHLPSASQSPC